MKILIIEDEPRAALYLRQGLTECGFVVDVATDGEAGLAAARLDEYALVLCDIMLPRRDGFSVIAELRRSGYQMPVLILSARDAVDARVHGFDVGADDYLVKPFAFAELVARVRALLRRAPFRPAEIFVVDDLVCDPRSRRVERAGRRIELSPKEYALLLFLLERSGEVVSRTLIAEGVWGMCFDSDLNVVDVQIRRLRLKLGADDDVPLIHTVRGVGYVLEFRADSKLAVARTERAHPD